MGAYNSTCTEDWTKERIARLKELRAQGMSSSAIARDLGGVTRSAVIGKARRLGLDPRPANVTASNIVPPPIRRPVLVVPAPAPVIEPPCAPVPLKPCKPMPIDGAVPGRSLCKWPIGDPLEPGFHLCGAQNIALEKPWGLAEQPYCASHCALAYRPQKPSQRDLNRALRRFIG